MLLTAASAAAEDSCVELSAELPREVERCVTAQRLCQSYQRAVAANGGEDEPAPVRKWQVQLHARRDAGALLLELDAVADDRPVGQRTLSVRTSDCAAVPDALALVLVLLAQEAGPVRAEPAPEPGPEPELPPIAAERPQAPAASQGTLAIGAGAGLSFGALPSTAFALQLQAATLRLPVALRLRAAFLWPQELTIAEGAVLMREYSLAVEACPGVQLADRPRFGLRACVGPRVGLLYARARDFTFQNDHTTEFLLYFGVTPEASLALGPTTWLQLSAGAALALIRPRIAVAFGDGQSRTVLPALNWLRAELVLSLLQNF